MRNESPSKVVGLFLKYVELQDISKTWEQTSKGLKDRADILETEIKKIRNKLGLNEYAIVEREGDDAE